MNNPTTGHICKRNCALDDKSICTGCGRSLPEILEWHKAEPARQSQIRFAANIRLNDRNTVQAQALMFR